MPHSINEKIRYVGVSNKDMGNVLYDMRYKYLLLNTVMWNCGHIATVITGILKTAIAK